MNYYIVEPRPGYYARICSTEAVIVGAESEEEAIEIAANLELEIKCWEILRESDHHLFPRVCPPNAETLHAIRLNKHGFIREIEAPC